jgi:hypothetical protein
MCVALPAAVAIAGLAASAIGTGVSVYGAVKQGQAAQDQANYQAQVSRNNAQVAGMQSDDALARGQEAENEQRRKTASAIGSQTAGIAGSGFELGDETSLSLLGDTAAFGEMDAQTIKQNASREAWGYRQQGANYTADAGLQVARGDAASSASYLKGGSDLLSGASKFASSYSTASKQFGWST